MGLYQTKRAFNNVPLGFEVRGSIQKAVTYRVRRGNGYYSSIAGRIYQDKYTYSVPASITNTQSEPYRRQLRAANAYWKYTLTADEKSEYNLRALPYKGLCGNTLFLREAMKGVFSMFVNRGDPASWDFALGAFTTDETWRELDLSSIIPTSAHAVLLEIEVRANAANKEIIFKPYGHDNAYNIAVSKTTVANIAYTRECTVPVDSTRKLLYWGENATFDIINLGVKGWWS